MKKIVLLAVSALITFSLFAKQAQVEFTFHVAQMHRSGNIHLSTPMQLDKNIEKGFQNSITTDKKDGRVFTTITAAIDGSWVALNTPSNDYSAVCFINDTDGCAGYGWSSNISQTQDGGDSWISVSSGSVMSLEFTDNGIGYAAGRNGNIIKSTDGGQTWIDIAPDEFSSTFFWTLDFITDDIGFVGGNGGVLLKTVDGGQTWTTLNPTGEGDRIYAIHFPSENIGYIGVQYKGVFKTTDGGITWNRLPNSIEQTVRSVYFVDENIGYIGYAVFGGDGGIQKTTDGGDTWTVLNTGVNIVTFNTIYFFDENNGFAGGWSGKLIKTIDGGETWIVEPLEKNGQAINGQVNDLTFPSMNTGYVATDDGIFKYTASSIPTLTVTPTTLELASEAGSTGNIAVVSNQNWEVTADVEWLTLSVSNGSNNDTVVVTATENITTDPRTAIVTFTAGALTATVTVIQAADIPTLTVTPTSLELASEAGSTGNIAVVSNQNWEVTADVEWLTLSVSNGSNNDTVVVAATENITTDPRTGIVTFTAGALTATVTVIQAADIPTLTVTPTTLELASEAGSTGNIAVVSNQNWEVIADVEWLTLSVSNGSNNDTVMVTATENTTIDPRTAIVTFTSGALTATVTITQAGTVHINNYEKNVPDIFIYPNPSNGVFIINFNEVNGLVTFQLIDIIGLVIEKQLINVDNSSEIIFNRHLPAGIYFVRIIYNETVYTRKLVIE